MNDSVPTFALIDHVVLTTSSVVRCTRCHFEEMVMPLDDRPLDEVFIANYVCNDCEDSDARSTAVGCQGFGEKGTAAKS